MTRKDGVELGIEIGPRTPIAASSTASERELVPPGAMSLPPTADLNILLRVFSVWKMEPSLSLGVQSHLPTLYPPSHSTWAAGLTKMKPHLEATSPLGCHCYLLQAYFTPLCYDLEPPLPAPGGSYCPNSAQHSSHLGLPTFFPPTSGQYTILTTVLRLWGLKSLRRGNAKVLDWREGHLMESGVSPLTSRGLLNSICKMMGE